MESTNKDKNCDPEGKNARSAFLNSEFLNSEFLTEAKKIKNLTGLTVEPGDAIGPAPDPNTHQARWVAVRGQGQQVQLIWGKYFVKTD